MVVHAPKITGDTWLNSPPLQPEDLKGKVILVDFWTYSCVNCQRTLPFIKQWWKKYKTMGLVIIGIHTPEFEFEEDLGNVKQAVEKLGVTWPVVLDNGHTNWQNFANHYWPSKYLIDQKGLIVYNHFGEGAYDQTEKEIQQLLDGKGTDMPPVSKESHDHGEVCFIPTPERYCGYGRGVLSNMEGYAYHEVRDYVLPEKILPDTLGLEGPFLAQGEYIESVSAQSKLNLCFRATEVNLVLHSVEKEAAVKILYNGEPLKPDIRGRDANEKDEVLIQTPTLYNLLQSKHILEGIITLQAVKGNFRAYAFTFSGCPAPVIPAARPFGP